jgi:hypothetical protein
MEKIEMAEKRNIFNSKAFSFVMTAVCIFMTVEYIRLVAAGNAGGWRTVALVVWILMGIAWAAVFVRNVLRGSEKQDHQDET